MTSRFEIDETGSFRFALKQLDHDTFRQIRQETLLGLRSYAANIDQNPDLQRDLPQFLQVLNDLKPDAALTQQLDLSSTEMEIDRLVTYLKTYLHL